MFELQFAGLSLWVFEKHFSFSKDKIVGDGPAFLTSLPFVLIPETGQLESLGTAAPSTLGRTPGDDTHGREIV